MLSFSILDVGNVSDYCNTLSDVLEKLELKATVFFVGRVAEQNPDAVAILDDDVDVGSQTYSYVDITSISDYTLQAEEVSEGKRAVDDAGNLGSRLFKAPYGATDENIYSLLSRSGILADFSYEDHYNVYRDGRFLKYKAAIYDWSEYSAEFFLSLQGSDSPIIIEFENTRAVADVSAFVSKLKSGDFEFVKASEIAGIDLTLRGV